MTAQGSEQESGPESGHGPDLTGFGRFLAELGTSFPEKSYRWTRAKERSCDWLIDRIPDGTVGVDIGGTEYLCQRLADKGCAITYYDFVAPRTFPTFVQDDMFNVLRHFEPGSLDFIATRHTLEHSIVPLFQLWAYNQLLADDGILLVTVPCYHDRWIWMTTHFHCVPPESWQMLFHRAGFGIREFESGSWKRGHAEFVEHRFVLEVQTRDLRLTGRPERTLASPPQALAAADPDLAPRGSAEQENTKRSAVQPGVTTWVGARRPWWRRG
ncbi:MAG: methyltransferase domain-containing protein [Candidatus Nanopelagicales bacterium]